MDALLELCAEGRIEWNMINEAIKNGTPASTRVEPVNLNEGTDKAKDGQDADTALDDDKAGDTTQDKLTQTDSGKTSSDKDRSDADDDTSDFQKSLGL